MFTGAIFHGWHQAEETLVCYLVLSSGVEGPWNCPARERGMSGLPGKKGLWLCA